MKRVTGWVLHRDISAFFWVNQAWRNKWNDRLMPIVTHLGGAVWCILLSVALLIPPSSRDLGWRLGLSLLASHLVVALCKKILPRKRPYQTLEGVITGRILMKDASFPSGHSTAAFCKATILAGAMPDFSVLFYLLAAWIALSRLYLGQHYPSDIMMGATLGTLTALLFV
jgi:undecaprenyl-diphosphatase